MPKNDESMAFYRLDYPEKNDDEWFCHVNLKKDESGQMVLFKRPVDRRSRYSQRSLQCCC